MSGWMKIVDEYTEAWTDDRISRVDENELRNLGCSDYVIRKLLEHRYECKKNMDFGKVEL